MMALNKDAQIKSQTFVVRAPSGPDVEFTGHLMVERMTETGGHIKVYGTDSGRYVVEQKRSALRGRIPLSRVAVVDDLDEMTDILGDTPGGKRVMEDLGRPCRIKV